MSSDPRLFRYLVEASTDGIWLLDGEGRTAVVQRADGRAAGPDPGGDGRALGVRRPRRGRPGAVRRPTWPWPAPATPGTTTSRRCTCAPDGEPIWLLASWRPVLDDDGQVLGYLHRYTDYTERRELLDALARPREAAGRGAVDRRHRQLGVGRRARPGGVVRPALPDLPGHPRGVRRHLRGLPRLHPPRRPRRTSGREVDSAFDRRRRVRVERPDRPRRRRRSAGCAASAAPSATPPAGRYGWPAPTRTSPTRCSADHEIREATRRLALLRQVAVVANQSTGLVEALLRTADAVGKTPGLGRALRLPRPSATTPSWCRSCSPGTDRPTASSPTRLLARGVPPDRRDRRTPGARARDHPQPGRHSRPPRRRRGLRGGGARRRGPARRELPRPRRADRGDAGPGGRARARGGRAGRGPRPGHGGLADEVAVPRDDEPRDPDPDERRARPHRPADAHRARRGAAGAWPGRSTAPGPRCARSSTTSSTSRRSRPASWSSRWWTSASAPVLEQTVPLFAGQAHEKGLALTGRRRAGRAGVPARRLDPARPGDRQPGLQRGEVHRQRRGTRSR